MILPFQKQFVPKILDGTKIHTIREDKGDRWQTGKKIHFATGVRTKNYHQFFEDDCKSIQKIVIWYNKLIDPLFPIIIIDKYSFQPSEFGYFDFLKRLAKNDGFDSIVSFLSWFNKDFTGKIIHWTDLKYDIEKFNAAVQQLKKSFSRVSYDLLCKTIGIPSIFLRKKS